MTRASPVTNGRRTGTTGTADSGAPPAGSKTGPVITGIQNGHRNGHDATIVAYQGIPNIRPRRQTLAEQWLERYQAYQHGAPWHEVQVDRQRGTVAIVEHRGPMVRKTGNIVVGIIAVSVCNSDIKVLAGDKTPNSDLDPFYVAGHEAVGIVLEADPASGFSTGQIVVILPHVWPKTHDEACNREPGPACIGRAETRHLGWDLNGLLGQFVQVPDSVIVPIPDHDLAIATLLAPDLPLGAAFCQVEPFLCALTTPEIVGHAYRQLRDRELDPAGRRVLNVGSGPMGVHNTLAFARAGWEVQLHDTVRSRIHQAIDCLGGDYHITAWDGQPADIVVVTAPNADAVKFAEEIVTDDGIIHLFAGLPKSKGGLEAMDDDQLVRYETAHRRAIPFLRLLSGGRRVITVGHSGYFPRLAPLAIQVVAREAALISRLLSGRIDGLTNPVIHGRPGIGDWHSPDRTPAIIRILEGENLIRHYQKIVLFPSTDPVKAEGGTSVEG